MKRRTGIPLLPLVIAALAVVFAAWMLLGGTKHIEDTNGPDNYDLTTITDQEIIKQTMGCIGLTTSSDALGNTVSFSSGKFTGVYEVMWTDIIFTTGLTLDILDFEVNGGNFKMAVVNEGEIIAVVEPNGSCSVELGEITGKTKLVIAGESADFSFRLLEHDYDSYFHE